MATGRRRPRRRDDAATRKLQARASKEGARELASIRRLEAVWAEADAAEAARLGEVTMADGSRCRFCQSWFPEGYRLAAHERECGRVGQPPPAAEETSMAANGHRTIVCKHCGHASPGLKEHAAHLLSAHREDTLARRRELAAQRTGKKQAGAAQTAPAARPALGASPGQSPEAPPLAGPCCPTCGGIVPARTAELLAALQAEGLGELQAFAAVRVARKHLGTSGA